MNDRFKTLCGSAAAAFLLFAAPTDLARAAGRVDTGLEAFLAADFTTHPSDVISNPWWTMQPNTNVLYFAEEDGECAWNLVEVLALTTDNFEGDYAGIDARVILDREWKDEGCLYDTFAEVWANLPPEETTYDWYAQDAAQNIWYLGEDTWDGDSGGSFIAGCDGAEAGIVMLGNPAKGDFYQQEFYAGEAEDQGKVLNFVPIDDLECLKIKEWNPLSPGNIEHKYYCSDGDIGQLVLIEELRGKTVIVNLVDDDVTAPPPPAAPPSPIPDC